MTTKLCWDCHKNSVEKDLRYTPQKQLTKKQKTQSTDIKVLAVTDSE